MCTTVASNATLADDPLAASVNHVSGAGLNPSAEGPRLAAVAGRARRASTSTHSLAEISSALASRLRGRLPELEAAVTTRVHAIADPREVGDPSYLHSLNSALTTALDYALVAIELGERRAPGIPPALLAEARLAARAGVPLDAVLRRYVSGNALLGDLHR